MTQPSPDLIQAVSQIRSWSIRSRPTDKADVVTIPFIIGTGTAVITPGIQGAIPIFFKGRLVSLQIQEFDGFTGSVQLDIQRFQGGSDPVPFSIVDPTPNFPTIVNGRFFLDPELTNWSTSVEYGDYLMVIVNTVAIFQRLSVAFSFRRK